MTLGDVRVLWAREMMQFYRRPLQVLSLLVGPLIWLFLFGVGIRASISSRTVNGFDYLHYILPGILGMILLNSSSRGGMSILRDREAGFLREVLVAPVSRFAILMGVGLGRVTRSLIQGALMITVGLFLGVNFGGSANAIASFVLAFVFLAIIGMSLVSLTIALAWKMGDIQSYAALTAWAVFPLTLMSGGVYPITGLPAWLALPIHLNPLTYGIDALRWAILGAKAATFPIAFDVAIMLGFCMTTMALGSIVMRKVT